MDFGQEHSGTMPILLRQFFFKRLTSPCAAGVQEFLQTNAMDCIVKACGLAITPDDEYHLPCLGPVYSKVTLVRKKTNGSEPCNWTKVKVRKKGEMVEFLKPLNVSQRNQTQP